MPHLYIRGISVDQTKEISTQLVKDLARLCECGEDNFTLEVLNSTFVFDKNEVPAYPFIEVKWFDRDKAIQNQFAGIISKYVRSLGVPEVEVAFSAFLEADYYLNGKSFAD
jgi:phenylpyruvate tautomerase PptA (4-oxalocrotonate tautomerase family)